ncbi:hypothetical protein ET33_30535 [Paenibacillus tyrfis]|uniref:Uncharacterized protein n=1 Tax=Paenibacillus tyrfis TaxID=1501230 RepID=A0A081NTT6_9BACL|nr:hypothetical protein ET33_30535 [Paenibacillus tyrfis]
MNKKYEIRLQVEEREQIEQLLHSKSTSKGIRHRCLVLLLATKGRERFQPKRKSPAAQESAKPRCITRSRTTARAGFARPCVTVSVLSPPVLHK